jgi:hypothetical protein
MRQCVRIHVIVSEAQQTESNKEKATWRIGPSVVVIYILRASWSPDSVRSWHQCKVAIMAHISCCLRCDMWPRLLAMAACGVCGVPCCFTLCSAGCPACAMSCCRMCYNFHTLDCTGAEPAEPPAPFLGLRPGRIARRRRPAAAR